jgi:hypothetical protein
MTARVLASAPRVAHCTKRTLSPVGEPVSVSRSARAARLRRIPYTSISGCTTEISTQARFN